MDLRARLRLLADALPDDGAVTLTAASLRAWLAEDSRGDREEAGKPLADLTVEQLADELGRSGSTIRGWLGEGVFPHAYKLRGKEWRIPRADVKQYLERQQRPAAEEQEREARPGSDDLGSWRNHMKKAS
jgi:excisionase family DNA binding protein